LTFGKYLKGYSLLEKGNRVLEEQPGGMVCVAYASIAVRYGGMSFRGLRMGMGMGCFVLF